MQQYIRKNFVSIILISLIGILLFVPNAKAFLLKGLLRTGIFNAGIKREATTPNAIPAISFTDNNNKRLTTTDLKGKVIFINFWATWCPPCIAEMGSINSLHNKLKSDSNIVFILVDADGNLQQSSAFMEKRQYNLPVYSVTGIVPDSLFSGTLPTTLIIDVNGNLVQKHEGIANWDTEGVIEFLTSLPSPPAPLHLR